MLDTQAYSDARFALLEPINQHIRDMATLFMSSFYTKQVGHNLNDRPDLLTGFYQRLLADDDAALAQALQEHADWFASNTGFVLRGIAHTLVYNIPHDQEDGAAVSYEFEMPAFLDALNRASPVAVANLGIQATYLLDTDDPKGAMFGYLFVYSECDQFNLPDELDNAAISQVVLSAFNEQTIDARTFLALARTE